MARLEMPVSLLLYNDATGYLVQNDETGMLVLGGGAWIYWRTQEDVDNHTDIGCINYTDANRIHDNFNHIAKLGEFTLPRPLPSSWAYNTLPDTEWHNSIRSNLLAILAAIPTKTVSVPPVPYNTWEKWNAIERIQFDVQDKLIRIINAKYYTGELNTNDDMGVI